MIWFVDKSLHFVFKWCRGCLTVRSSWVWQPFDWVFVCMFSPCLCGQTGNLVGVPSLSPSGSWGRLQPITNHILSIYYSWVFCYVLFFLAQKSSNNWLLFNCIDFILVHGLHVSLLNRRMESLLVLQLSITALWFLIWSFATSSREFDLLYTELLMHLSHSSAPVFAHTLSVALLTTVSLSTEPYPCSSLLSCGQARTSYKLFWNVIRQKWKHAWWDDHSEMICVYLRAKAANYSKPNCEYEQHRVD